MEMDFIRNRITELRVKKGVSEYQLSYDLGHSKNYIHNIVTGKSNFSSGDYRWHQVDERSRFRSCSADGQALE